MNSIPKTYTTLLETAFMFIPTEISIGILYLSQSILCYYFDPIYRDADGA